MSHKQKAFTIVETLTVLGIIGLIAAFTVASTLNSQNMKLQKNATLSKAFYTEAEYAYQSILNSETTGFNITKLNDAEYNIEEDTKQLEKLFESYMELFPISCNELPHNSTTSGYFEDEVKCATSNRGINAGFYLDRNCSNRYQTREYLQEDLMNTKTVENACGYIIYAPKKSDGIIAQDFFIIGLGKRGIK